jgi:dTDP-glucose 4,6-dehydratase
MDFSGRGVLVTGGGGFIGGHLARALSDSGADVRILDDFRYRKQDRGIKAKVFRGDVCDKSIVRKSLEGVDVVYHLAAVPFVPDCDRDKAEALRVNVEGTRTVAEAALGEGVGVFIHISSAEVYGPAQGEKLTEKHLLNPQSPYAQTKVAAEGVIREFRGRGLPTVTLRVFNTYGPADTHPRIIPELFSQFSRGNTLKLGNLMVSRDFVYVDDTVSAMTAAARKNLAGEVFNVGTGVETSLIKLAGLVAELMGVSDYSMEVDEWRVRRPDVNRLCADSGKAQGMLGWKPNVGLKEGLSRTCEWFKLTPEAWSWRG